MAAVAKWVGIGLAVGVVTSVLPVEVLMLSPLGYVAVIALAADRARKERSWRPLAPSLTAFAATLAVATAAVFLPFKYIDSHALEGLNGRCVPFGDALQAFRRRSADVAPALLEKQVCFSSARPSLREAFAAIEDQLGVHLQYGYCGSGVTLLWGAHPIGGPRIVSR